MTDDTKSHVKKVAGFSVGILATLAGGLYVAHQVTVPDVPKMRVTWSGVPDGEPLTAEWWATTNLVTWYPKTNVPSLPGSNFLALPALLKAEFFIVRHRNAAGATSDWARVGR